MDTGSPRLFVSYKSEDAQIVRAVVEQLASCSIRAWFAEYDLLSRDHLRLEQVQERSGDQEYNRHLQSILKGAIEHCTHGLAFTNTLWGKSDYCKDEIRWLRAHLGYDSPRILQVCIPKSPLPDDIQQLVKDCRTLIVDPQAPDLPAIVRFVLQHISPQTPCDIPVFGTGQLREFEERGRWAAMQFGPFEVQPESMEQYFDQLHENRARIFHGTLYGEPLQLRIAFRPTRPRLSSWQLAERRPNSPATEGIDDRRVNALLRKKANEWLAGSDREESGCHLFWRGPTGHLAVTYRERASAQAPGGWCRAYILVLEDPVTFQLGEFELAFKLPCDRGSERDAYPRFLRIAHLLDAMAESLDNYGRLKRRSSDIWLVTVLCAGVGAACAALLPIPVEVPWKIALGVLAGVLAVPTTLQRIRPD